MTIDLTNISKMGVQPLQSSQLPPVKSGDPEYLKTDNVVHFEAVIRQSIAITENAIVTVQQDQSDRKQPDNGLNQSVSELNSSHQIVSRNLEFHIDKNSGRTVITVRDSESKEIIRQIPSEQLLEISSRLKDIQESNLENNLAAGILFTSKT